MSKVTLGSLLTKQPGLIGAVNHQGVQDDTPSTYSHTRLSSAESLGFDKSTDYQCGEIAGAQIDLGFAPLRMFRSFGYAKE